MSDLKPKNQSKSCWKIVELQKCLLGKPDYGINAAGVMYSDNLPAYIRITDISIDGKFIPENKTSVAHENSDKYILEMGDVLIARTGASVGKTYLYREEDGTLVFAGFLIRVRADQKSLDSRFFFAYTHTDKYFQWVKETSTRSGQPGVNSVEISNIKIPLPPLPEQKRIVAVLETWDKAIELLTKKIEIKKKIKKGLMQELLTGKRRLKGFDGEWKRKTLSEIGHFSKGAGIRKDQVVKEGLNAVRYGELYTKYDFCITAVFSKISPNIADETVQIKYGDILFAGSGGTIEDIGKSATYLLNDTCYAGGDIVIFSPENCNSVFLSYLLNTGEARKGLNELGQGQSVVHLYKRDLEKLIIKVPSLNEQDAIAEMFVCYQNELKTLQTKLSLLQTQKKYLLNNLVTGKIRTPENLTIN